MQGRYPLPPPPLAFFKACRSEIYIAKQEEVWREKKGEKSATSGERSARCPLRSIIQLLY